MSPWRRDPGAFPSGSEDGLEDLEENPVAKLRYLANATTISLKKIDYCFIVNKQVAQRQEAARGQEHDTVRTTGKE